MSKTKNKFSAKQLRTIRFGGVLLFVGTFIFAFIFTGNDSFLKRCVANGNSVKYCNDIYDDRNLAFKDKQLEKEEKRRKRVLEKEEKRKQRELEIAEERIKELELAQKRKKEPRKLIVKTEYYDNGDKYVGEWKDGKRHGQGKYTFGNGRWKGDKYVGQFLDDKFHGQGTYTFADGRKYIGQWKDSEKQGRGTFTFPNGDKYVGEWKKTYHGQGTYYWRNGDRYVGQWRNGEKYGKGTYIYANGRTEKQYW